MKVFASIVLVFVLIYTIDIHVKVRRIYKTTKSINSILTNAPDQLMIEADTLSTEQAWDELNKAYAYEIKNR